MNFAMLIGIIDTPSVNERFGQAAEAGTRLEPSAIAQAYLYLHNQDKSCWTQEVRLHSAFCAVTF